MLKHELLYVVLQKIEVRGRGERCLHLMKHANSSKDGSGKREKPVNELARKADFGGVFGGGIGNGGGCGVLCAAAVLGFAVVDGAVFGNVIIRHKSLLIGTVRVVVIGLGDVAAEQGIEFFFGRRGVKRLWAGGHGQKALRVFKPFFAV